MLYVHFVAMTMGLLDVSQVVADQLVYVTFYELDIETGATVGLGQIKEVAEAIHERWVNFVR